MRNANGPFTLVVLVAVAPFFVFACQEAAPRPASTPLASARPEAIATIPASAKEDPQTALALSHAVPRTPPSEPSELGSSSTKPAPEPAVEAQPKALSAAACRKIVKRSEAGFRVALTGVKHDCSTDAECTLERATCLPGCGGSGFALADRGRYDKLAAAPRAECTAFDDGLCTVSLALPIPSCHPYVPVCAKGRCAAVQK